MGDKRIISIKVVDKYRPRKCKHDGGVIVDGMMWRVECALCGEAVDPIAYLLEVAREEAYVEFRVNELRRHEDALLKKRRCKCEHCGKMTRIAR